MKFTEAQEILNAMHFGARVVRKGRCRGMKQIWWTTTDGVSAQTPFTRETTWETILDYAKQQLPVWDRAMLFEIGDVIEFDWKGRTQAVVVEIEWGIQHYVLESPVFEKGWFGHRRSFGNYDLKFHKKAVKVGAPNTLNPEKP